jgi:hypothetical protein
MNNLATLAQYNVIIRYVAHTFGPSG